MKYLIAFLVLATLFDVSVNQAKEDISITEVAKEESEYTCHSCGVGVLFLAEDGTMNCNYCGIKVH